MKEKKALGVDDQLAVKEFINKLFVNVKDFYEGKIRTEDIAAYYISNQTNVKVDNIDAKVDKMLNVIIPSAQATTVRVQEESKTVINKKMYSMPENIILRKIYAYKSITKGYALLCHPEEAFLLSSAGLGSLDKVLNVLSREDLLDFGIGKRIKKIKVAKWGYF